MHLLLALCRLTWGGTSLLASCCGRKQCMFARLALQCNKDPAATAQAFETRPAERVMQVVGSIWKEAVGGWGQPKTFISSGVESRDSPLFA